jgi:hypothetical protein
MKNSKLLDEMARKARAEIARIETARLEARRLVSRRKVELAALIAAKAKKCSTPSGFPLVPLPSRA